MLFFTFHSFSIQIFTPVFMATKLTLFSHRTKRSRCFNKNALTKKKPSGSGKLIRQPIGYVG